MSKSQYLSMSHVFSSSGSWQRRGRKHWAPDRKWLWWSPAANIPPWWTHTHSMAAVSTRIHRHTQFIIFNNNHLNISERLIKYAMFARLKSIWYDFMFSCFISVLLLPEEQHHQYHSSYLVLPRYRHTTSSFSAFSGSSSFCSCRSLQPLRPCCAIPQLLRPLISAFLGLFSPEFVGTVAENRQSSSVGFQIKNSHRVCCLNTYDSLCWLTNMELEKNSCWWSRTEPQKP